MGLRRATAADVPLLAAMNGQVLEDESHHLRLSAAELENRMRGWLAGEYQAALFIDAGDAAGYALFRPDEHGIYLRQFYVERGRRRQGMGRKAIELLRQEISVSFAKAQPNPSAGRAQPFAGRHAAE